MSKRRWEDLVVGSLLWGLLWLGGCANGVTMGEVAFAARVALVLDGDPTEEEVQGLVDSALRIAESRGLNEEQMEVARLAASTAMVVFTSSGDWRVALAELLEVIETGEPE